MRSRLLYQQLPWWVLAHKVSAVGTRGKTWQGISNFKIKSEFLLEEKATLSNIKSFSETAQVHLEAKLVGEAGLNPTFAAFHWTQSNRAGTTAVICKIRTCEAGFKCLLSLQDLPNKNRLEVSWSVTCQVIDLCKWLYVVIYFAHRILVKHLEGGEKVDQSNDSGKFPFKRIENGLGSKKVGISMNAM